MELLLRGLRHCETLADIIGEDHVIVDGNEV